MAKKTKRQRRLEGELTDQPHPFADARAKALGVMLVGVARVQLAQAKAMYEDARDLRKSLPGTSAVLEAAELARENHDRAREMYRLGKELMNRGH